MEEKMQMRATKTSDHLELDVQNQLEAAYKDLIKAREESALSFEKNMNEAFLDFDKALRDSNSTDGEGMVKRSPIDLEREFVNRQFDNRQKHEADFKEAKEIYESKVREVYANADLKDADLRTLAEVSRVINWFASVN